MESGVKRSRLAIAVLAGCLCLCGAAPAQLVLGQYEDEAPLGTWNILGSAAAAAVGLGGAQFARAWDGSASLVNPALLLTLPRLSASISGSFTGASLYRYSLVNTGVVQSSGNPSVAVVGVDQGSVALRAGKWALAAVVAGPESYVRPAISAGSAGYELTFDQTGQLRIFHAGVARRLPAGLSLGVGVNFAAGRLERATVERAADAQRVVTITADRSERTRGFFLNGGLTWEATGRLTAALIVRSPYVRKGPGRSLLRYEVPVAGTDIRIDAEATNSYRQPWVVGAGVSFRITEAWSLAADGAFFGWSRYGVTSFEEPLPRPFRNVLRVGGGVEHLAPSRLFGKPVRIPFRVGFSVDPQPMATVHSSYFALTFGTGLELAALAVDISGGFGREKGSGRSLKSGKIVLSVRYVAKPS